VKRESSEINNLAQETGKEQTAQSYRKEGNSKD
jgi:hypothetical protein